MSLATGKSKSKPAANKLRSASASECSQISARAGRVCQRVSPQLSMATDLNPDASPHAIAPAAQSKLSSQLYVQHILSVSWSFLHKGRERNSFVVLVVLMYMDKDRLKDDHETPSNDHHK